MKNTGDLTEKAEAVKGVLKDWQQKERQKKTK